LMETFRHDPECKVFLSTDAGGVGLNLQAASAVINFEPPWNPARLEQRIGRVHRLGQSQPVQVVHFLTTGSIEERVWETLKVKKSLFAGVFDSPTAEVSFAALGKKSVLEAVKDIFADQPPPQAVPLATAAEPPAPSPASTTKPDVEEAAGALLEAGIRFLESLSPQRSGGGNGSPIQQALSTVFQQDPRTNRPVLAIPLPQTVTQERLAGALAGLLSFGDKFRGQATKPLNPSSAVSLAVPPVPLP